MVSVACPHCSGTGQRELTEVERETLEAVGEEWTQLYPQLVLIQDRTRCTAFDALATLQTLHTLDLVERLVTDESGHEWRRAR